MPQLPSSSSNTPSKSNKQQEDDEALNNTTMTGKSKQSNLEREYSGVFDSPKSTQSANNNNNASFVKNMKANKGWNAMRQRLVRIVAISRADILRREEVHLSKMRGRISNLSQELASVSAERDLLVEKVVDSLVDQCQ